jgi:hypothetical protein
VKHEYGLKFGFEVTPIINHNASWVLPLKRLILEVERIGPDLIVAEVLSFMKKRRLHKCVSILQRLEQYERTIFEEGDIGL